MLVVRFSGGVWVVERDRYEGRVCVGEEIGIRVGRNLLLHLRRFWVRR